MNFYKTNDISFEKLKEIADEKEGIVFTNCGHTIERWIKEVTQIFIKEKAVKKKDWFENFYVYVSEKDRYDLIFIPKKEMINKDNLVYVKMGFSGMYWLSDYIQNPLVEKEGFVVEKLFTNFK